MGKRLLYIFFSTVLTVLSGHVADAQTNEDLMHYGDSLHMAYDFGEAEDVFLQLLDSLDVVEDSVMVGIVREKLRMSENASNMSRFVQVPQAAGKGVFPSRSSSSAIRSKTGAGERFRTTLTVRAPIVSQEVCMRRNGTIRYIIRPRVHPEPETSW